MTPTKQRQNRKIDYLISNLKVIHTNIELNPMMMTEVEKVYESLRIKKAQQRKAREEQRKREPRLVLTESEKVRLIENNRLATQEGREDCAKWVELKLQHTKMKK